MKAHKRTRPRMGLMTKLVVLAMLIAIGWQVYSLRDQVADAQAEKEQYAELVAQQERENAALAADIAQGPTGEKLEEIARDELGYVKSGEYVFDPTN